MDKPKIDSKRDQAFKENMAKRQKALAMNLSIARKVTGSSHRDLLGPNVSTRITVRRIERGDRDPRLSSIVSLATSLGISPALLLLTGDEIMALGNHLEKWRAQIAEVMKDDKIRPDAVLLEFSNPETREQVYDAIELAEKVLKPRDKAESIGTAIGTAHKPGKASYIGKALGRALKAW